MALKWTIGLVGLVLCGALVGCGSGGDKTSDSSPQSGEAKANTKKLKIGVVFDSGGLGDKSFNDSAWAGVQRAKKEFDIEERHVESKSLKDVETNLATLAEQGCDIVFAIGINQKESLEKVAPQYPETKFAIVDAEPNPSLGLTNVRSLKFKEEEGSFLAGYLAGLVTKTNKIGFVGGQEIPLIKKFYSGYVAGARTANPDIVIMPAKYTGDWVNVDLAKAAASLLFDQGADIVYHAAGRAGLGVLDAAKEKKKFGIGVDSNQDDVAPGHVLTSMVKRVDEAVYSTIRDLYAGNFTAGVEVYDLKEGGVGLTEMQFTRDQVGPEVLAKVDEIKEKIISGEISVPTTEAELAAFQPK